MAKGFNKVILMGNLTRDPEMRTTQSGQNVANFSLAVGRTWKNANGEQQEQTSYINCVAWGKTGEIIEKYVRKGSPLLVSGRLDQRSWEDKESGQKRSTIEVSVEDFNFVSGGRDASAMSSNSGASSQPSSQPAADDIDDKPIDLSEIPF